MAKKRTKPGDWFVTQDEFKVMLYAIASDYNALKARVTALESQLPAPEPPPVFVPFSQVIGERSLDV